MAAATLYAGNFGSPVQLLILLAVVLLLFGGKRLRNLGGDLGGAIKGFKQAMNNDQQGKLPAATSPDLPEVKNELEKNRTHIGG